MMGSALSVAPTRVTGSSASRDRVSIQWPLASAAKLSPVEETPPMPMARPFPAFCLLFRHPSRATMLRGDRGHYVRHEVELHSGQQDVGAISTAECGNLGIRHPG